MSPYRYNRSGNSFLQEEKKPKGYLKGLIVLTILACGIYLFLDKGEEKPKNEKSALPANEVTEQKTEPPNPDKPDLQNHQLMVEKKTDRTAEKRAELPADIDLVADEMQNAPATDTETEKDQVVVGKIEVSLYNSFAGHFDKNDKKEQLYAQQLAAHFKRLFFFDINFKRDLRPDDSFAFVWELTDDSTDGIRILAAKYYSNKLKRLFEAYYYKDDKEKYGRHYDSKGVEVQKRLQTTPIRDYEQVTSLLHDRRPRHNGIDFKAPIGTPLYLPFDAKVLRLSKRITRGNGRYVKVSYLSSGLHALFLHMDSIDPGVKSGKVLKAGTPIGSVGNTGRSYAPHLHYQVQKSNGRILDPYKVHGFTRRKISQGSIPGFKEYVKKMNNLMSQFDQEVDQENRSIRR